jgi:hypothetical protein
MATSPQSAIVFVLASAGPANGEKGNNATDRVNQWGDRCREPAYMCHVID